MTKIIKMDDDTLAFAVQTCKTCIELGQNSLKTIKNHKSAVLIIRSLDAHKKMLAALEQAREQGRGMTSVGFLRNVHTDEDPSYVGCIEGDPGAFEVYRE